jgi:hypothetical protein
MSGSPKLPREIRTQLGVGTVLAIAGVVWMFIIFFVLKPEQIVPTKDYLSDIYDGMRSIAGTPSDKWGLTTAAELVGSFLYLFLMNVLYVVARIGWLTLLSLGGFALFEAISRLRKARR